jgi:hypothetical protein
MAQSVSITASTIVTGAVTPGVLVLDPTKRSTTVLLTTVIGSSNATVQVEYSLDDPTIPGGPVTTWALLSSATAIASSNSNGLSWTVLSPIAQVRVNSTSGSTGTTVPTFTLKALQSITA